MTTKRTNPTQPDRRWINHPLRDGDLRFVGNRSGARGHGEEHVSVSPVLRRRPGAVSLCLKGDRCGDGSWHGGELSTKGHHHYCTTTTFAYSWRHLIRCASLMELYYRIGTGRHQNFRHPFRCYRPINSLVPQSQKYALV